MSVMTADEILDTLPDRDDVGIIDVWEISSKGSVVEFNGKFIAFASSGWDSHNPNVHGPGEFAPRPGPKRRFVQRDDAPPTPKCPACRWFEVRIFREYEGKKPGRYIVHKTGMTIVPGEIPFTGHEWFPAATDVLEALTIRPSRGEPFITRQSAQAMAMAAGQDADMDKVWDKSWQNSG